MVSIRKALSVPPEQYERFLNLPGERILLATRTHIYTALINLFFAVFLFLLVILGTGYTFFSGHLTLVSSLLLITACGVIILVASLISFASWYYHFYIVTNRKILEVKKIPFFSSSANDVLLDQVRCTEIDIKREGMIHMLFNIGTIIITFDRPTHQEAFSLNNLHDPENIGLFLGDMLETRKAETTTIWSKPSHDAKYQMTDEIFPTSFAIPS